MCVSPRSGGADCTLSEGGPVAGPCRRVLVGCWLIHHAAVRLAVAAHHVDDAMITVEMMVTKLEEGLALFSFLN